MLALQIFPMKCGKNQREGIGVHTRWRSVCWVLEHQLSCLFLTHLYPEYPGHEENGGNWPHWGFSCWDGVLGCQAAADNSGLTGVQGCHLRRGSLWSDRYLLPCGAVECHLHNERALSGRHITDDRAHCYFCFMSRLDVDRNRWMLSSWKWHTGRWMVDLSLWKPAFPSAGTWAAGE